MARLLSLSEQSDPEDRGSLTRSPLTTAVALMSHHDVISGFLLVIDLVCSSIDSRVQRAQICQMHHGMKSIWSGATVYKQPVLDLNGVVAVLPKFTSWNRAQPQRAGQRYESRSRRVETGRCAWRSDPSSTCPAPRIFCGPLLLQVARCAASCSTRS